MIALSKAYVGWTPNRPDRTPRKKGAVAGSVEVQSHKGAWLDRFDLWLPATMDSVGGDIPDRLMLFILFNTLVVRDGIDPQVAHSAFLKIDEYRETISPDMQGAAR